MNRLVWLKSDYGHMGCSATVLLGVTNVADEHAHLIIKVEMVRVQMQSVV
jgi:hypothetical protein